MCVSLQQVRQEQFLNRCKVICHVGPAGAWEQIARQGLRTAEQLIMDADLGDDERQCLLSTPRKESVRLSVSGEEVILRDQGPLYARKDLKSASDTPLDMSDWIHLLNQRAYFFADEVPFKKFLDKYVERDGSQDVIWLSPLKLLAVEDIQLELTTKSIGAIPRRTGPQKATDTFVPLFRFPDKRPAEVTVLNGLNDLSAVVRAERHFQDGRRELLT
jgi:hypothetical protein